MRLRRAAVTLAALGLGAALLAAQPVSAAPGGAAAPAAPVTPSSHPRPVAVVPGADVHHGPGQETDANVCGYSAAPGIAHCDARVRTDASATSRKPQPDTAGASAGGINPATSPIPNNGGYDPYGLQHAYQDTVTATSHGGGQVVAIADAYDDPNVTTDLAFYRSYFGLSPCPAAKLSSNGTVPIKTSCSFYKVNQQGVEGSYPVADPGWATEISLDVEMVSAICPNCSILLVEANTNNYSDLASSVSEAVKLGADVVSNSYGGYEFSGQQAYDSYYDQPGVAVVVAAGDSGYGAEYPATSPTVTSVGGTTLDPPPSGSTAFTETVWNGTGSGCSAYETQAPWQASATTACPAVPTSTSPGRMVADVSAVADPSTGVWVYDSYASGTCTGRSTTDPAALSCFAIYGGTSVATPIISSYYALAQNNTLGSTNTPAAYPYAAGHGDLYDVTSGANAYGTVLNGMSCPSTGQCVGVDGNGNTVSSVDPGAASPTWSVDTKADPGGFLSAVDCPTTTLCVAGDYAGDIFTSTTPTTDTAWSETPAKVGNAIDAVSCSPPTSNTGGSGLCMAVDSFGYVLTSTSPSKTNSWSATSTAVDLNGFYAVSCPSASECVAVDNSGEVVVGNLSKSWTWTGPVQIDSDYFNAVSCPSTTLCALTDSSGDLVTGNPTTLAPNATTATWTSVAADPLNYLYDVSCASTSLCVAVDDYGNSVTSIDPGASSPAWQLSDFDGTNFLSWISCVNGSPNDLCVATDGNGEAVSSSNPQSGVAATWTFSQPEPGCSPVIQCEAGVGYDGPTGLGTPDSANSLTAFTESNGALHFSPSSLPNGVIGTAYSQALTAGGGAGSDTWTTSGALPTGVSFSSSGPSASLSGTPTAAGTYKFTVQVTDAAHDTAALAYTVVITPVHLQITTTSPLPGATVHVKYSDTLTAGGGTSPYSWKVSSGKLPGGLTVSSAGVLSGTPTRTGTYSFTVQVTDSGSPHQTASAPFTLTVG